MFIYMYIYQINSIIYILNSSFFISYTTSYFYSSIYFFFQNTKNLKKIIKMLKPKNAK